MLNARADQLVRYVSTSVSVDCSSFQIIIGIVKGRLGR
jgi:hypothetical protein